MIENVLQLIAEAGPVELDRSRRIAMVVGMYLTLFSSNSSGSTNGLSLPDLDLG